MKEAVDRLAEDVGELLGWACFPRDDKELAEAAEAISVQMSRLEAARALVAGQLAAADHARREGATSTRVWMAQRCHISIGAAHHSVQLGEYLGGAHLGGSGLRVGSGRERLLSAVSAGEVTSDQALVIGKAVAELPDKLGVDVRKQAEQTLIGLAATLTPRELAVAGERILDMIAPEVADQAEAERLARRDRDEHRKREFHIRTDHTGCSRLSGRLDAEATATLRLAIEALARPMPAADGTRDVRSAGERNADALHELCRLSLDEGRLPEHGGSKPQIIVTIDYDTLAGRLADTALSNGSPDAGMPRSRMPRSRMLGSGTLGSGTLGSGTLDSGVRLSAETVRRLACDAQIIPAVLGSAGELLDLGRSQRLVNTALRNALTARDRGCQFPGCDRPARWCQAHHVIGWAQGGPTSLDNSVLLCGAHHRIVHNGGWRVTRQSDRRFAFIPPPHVDPLQRPRVNTVHRRT